MGRRLLRQHNPSHLIDLGVDHKGYSTNPEELTELRRRLKEMKDLLGSEESDLSKLVNNKKKQCSFLDGNMVSLVFAVAMGLVLSVTVYAFQHLYTAVMKRFNLS
ncbi:unnamed protein product [Notodromas monacha]|uniref:Uncharacterized protein n=1 Tax=Notodromas monacha TaxID=399045 RepID=A0A7R9GFH1_9CRUS|nr:unnamed protein product [Notodromas monacha]CAG0919131.1 unnamed protein product [Notodromas monacha]